MNCVRTHAIIDSADKDVTVFVVVPTEVPLTVPAGKSFREAAKAFCDREGLDALVWIKSLISCCFYPNIDNCIDYGEFNKGIRIAI